MTVTYSLDLLGPIIEKTARDVRALGMQLEKLAGAVHRLDTGLAMVDADLLEVKSDIRALKSDIQTSRRDHSET